MCCCLSPAEPVLQALVAERPMALPPDGEGVVCGPNGVSDFDLLRASVGRKGPRNAFLYAFDVLELNGVDLSRELWDERRKVLARLLQYTNEGIQLSEHLGDADGAIVFHHACRLGLEGIVAKRRDRPYRSGRSTDWIKIRNPNAPAATRLLEE
jgi:bifunctional non-homologous end joining protein LigD